MTFGNWSCYSCNSNHHDCDGTTNKGCDRSLHAIAGKVSWADMRFRKPWLGSCIVPLGYVHRRKGLGWEGYIKSKREAEAVNSP
jgi:hypothetical protein